MREIYQPDWIDRVRTTNPEYTRKVVYGKRHFTSINATSQIIMATNEFGMYGAYWGVRNLKFSTVTDENNRPLLLVLDAIFFYPLNEDDTIRIIEFPISSEISYWEGERKQSLVQDMRKKLLTDVTTKSLSKLGFNADVFLGMYDDQKYVSNIEGAPLLLPKWNKKITTQTLSVIERATNKPLIDRALEALNHYSGFPKADRDIIIKAATTKIKTLKS